LDDDSTYLIVMYNSFEPYWTSLDYCGADCVSASESDRTPRSGRSAFDAVLQGRPGMVTMPDAICLEGGLPLVRNGAYVGAIGVSGMKSSEDGVVAEAGALALGA
jgi:glc operon protein GlcG